MKHFDFLTQMNTSYKKKVFITFFLYSIISLTALGFIISMVFYMTLKSNVEAQAAENTKTISSQLSNLVVDSRNIISTIEDENLIISFLTSGNNNTDNQDVLKELYLAKQFSGNDIEISVINANTGIWITTNNKHRNSNLNESKLSDWGIFRLSNNSDSIVIGTTVKENFLSTDNRIMIAEAYRQNKVVRGYILLEISRDTLSRIIDQQVNSYNTPLMITNDQMSIIYHSKGTDYEGLDALSDYGSLSDFSKDSKDPFKWSNFVCCHNSDLNVDILSEMPSNILSKVLTLLFRLMIIILIIVLFISYFLSMKIAGNIAKPVQNLRETMSKFKNGDTSVRANVDRKDEIGELEVSFNSMADNVELLIKNIDEEKYSLWLAETRSLNLQMNPHFLYNTLDIIKWEAKLGNTVAVENITVKLGKVLRRIMVTQDDLVPLSYELEIVEAFTDIMKLHYEDLSLSEYIEASARNIIIPKLVIQPIVENSIVHGFLDKTGQCHIDLSVLTERQYLIVTVTDNGNGMDDETLNRSLAFKQDNTHHIGLYNVQRRARLYGDETCGITVKSRVGKGTTMILRLKMM